MDNRSHCNDAGYYAYLLNRTRYYARYLEMPEDDAEDCALETAEDFLLKDPPRIPANQLEGQIKHWLDMRAWHSALDHHKKWMRRQKREGPLPEDTENVEVWPLWKRDDASDRPDALMFGLEWKKRFRRAMSRLSPAQQELFYRRCILKESAKKIAADLGRSTHAIDESLSYTKKRLRKFLQEEKLDLAESQDYLAAMRGH